jgi:hypothetical protein
VLHVRLGINSLIYLGQVNFVSHRPPGSRHHCLSPCPARGRSLAHTRLALLPGCLRNLLPRRCTRSVCSPLHASCIMPSVRDSLVGREPAECACSAINAPADCTGWFAVCVSSDRVVPGHLFCQTKNCFSLSFFEILQPTLEWRCNAGGLVDFRVYFSVL